MQAEKFPDLVSPDLEKSNKSGTESDDTSSVYVITSNQCKSKSQGKEKRAKKLGIEPAAAVRIFFENEFC